METKQRKYLIEEVKGQIERYHFHLRVAEISTEILTSYIGKKVTKREGNKIAEKLLTEFPESRFYMHDEKWGRDFQFLMKSGWGAKNECRDTISIESLSSDKIYTQALHEKHLEGIEHKRQFLSESKATLSNIHELIALSEKQDQEREELEKRQQLERETFAKQAKCPNTDISFYIKQAHERISEEERQEYFRKRDEEFTERMKFA